MVAPTVTYRAALAADLLRALARAQADKLVIFRRSERELGVAVVHEGRLYVKPYVLTSMGEAAGALRCSCDAAAHGRLCKHLAAGIFARKYHVYARLGRAEGGTQR